MIGSRMTVTYEEIRRLDYMRRPEDVAAYYGIPVERVRKIRGVTKNCATCGTEFRARPTDKPSDFARRNCCSDACAGKQGSIALLRKRAAEAAA